MKIETKFDIGQEVYIIESKKESGYKTTKVYVKSMHINTDKTGVKILYYVGNGNSYWECGLFKTRAEAQARIKMIY